ncbi:MAG: Flp pilus assembly complex ATPase component TadA [Actinobacteria bacterium]|nr:Flp pilus assembly complex ATPase component TadA [Actinomycetota bacterium]
MTEAQRVPLPTELPMYAGRRPGRVRSNYRHPDEAGGMPEALAPAGEVIPAGASADPPRPVGPVDWKEVARLRGEVARRLADRLVQIAGQVEEEAEGWTVIRELLAKELKTNVTLRAIAPGEAEEEALAQAIFDSTFGLGRLQPLVDDHRVENILVVGHERVVVEHSDGSMHQMPAVADSDAELVDSIRFIAGRSDNPRSFTPSHPFLNLTLSDGSRLAASLETGRPSLVIRRHRIRKVTLNDLVEWGTISEVMADFLSAAVRARKSILVSGAQGAGKTTLVRALCAEIPRMEVVATFESERELFLPELEGQHAVVFDWEMRAGSGERSADGQLAGQRTTANQITSSFRFRADRQIVGEVLGAEAMDMIKVMESGTGSLSTTHAANASVAVNKIITCALEAGPHISHDLVAAKLAATLDLVVQMHSEITPIDDFGQIAQKRRYVSEIVEVTPGEWPRGFALTTVFRKVPGRPAVAQTRADSIWGDLVAAGFNQAAFEREATTAHLWRDRP